MESWKPIPEFPAYEVSDQGRVRRGGRVLAPRPQTNGYHRVNLWRENVGYDRYIHRLVCGAFVGDAPTSDAQVDHINSARSDNRAANLRWVSPADNKSDRKLARGERNGASVLTAADVAEVRTMLRANNNTVIARKFRVCKGTIRDIREGITWK
jgi:hypothetical protein